jgi:hypothetical protein
MADNAPLATNLLSEFAQRTGVTGARPRRRYLWTDAFAVCTCLGLEHEPGFAARALQLVEQVHGVLGRHRGDDGRHGWISGLDEDEGARHPTAGGLRIGKPLPERRVDEAFDAAREWDRDGQYFHYLTRWVHALAAVAAHTGHVDAPRWARELAEAAVRRFLLASEGGPPHLAWKMSIDLARPLVPSPGQHDALDGLVACLRLRAHASGEDAARIDALVSILAGLVAGHDLRTDDPLGLGGLLVDAWILRQLPEREHGDALAGRLLALAAEGLERWVRQRPLAAPAHRRLAFRELGLAIGLHAARRIAGSLAGSSSSAGQVAVAGEHAMRAAIARLQPLWPLAGEIEAFWSMPAHQSAETWTAHEDINAVMLAASLAPAGYLDLGLPPRTG